MKRDLYIINYRNSYLSPICLIQEDNKNLKILITTHELTIIILYALIHALMLKVMINFIHN